MAQVFVVVAAGSVIAFVSLSSDIWNGCHVQDAPPVPIMAYRGSACSALAREMDYVLTARLSQIVRDLGDAAICGWIIQGPLLMQSVLSPVVGRLSDVLDRKYLAAVPPLIAFVGACISAKAKDMSMLIGGGVLIGVTLSTIAIVQAIPSEVLPL